MAHAQSNLKDEKIQLRIQPRQKALISQAARVRQTTLSAFMVENACAAAQQVLADEMHFVLSPGQWDAFQAALDRPPRKNRALAKLLKEPGVFDEKSSS